MKEVKGKKFYELFIDFLLQTYDPLSNLILDMRSANESRLTTKDDMEMRTIYLPGIIYKERKLSERTLETALMRWNWAFVFSAVLGGITGLAGTTIGMLSLLRLLSDHQKNDNFGTVLLVAAFPLLVFAAHCLDKAHETEKAIRKQRTGWYK